MHSTNGTDQMSKAYTVQVTREETDAAGNVIGFDYDTIWEGFDRKDAESVCAQAKKDGYCDPEVREYEVR